MTKLLNGLPEIQKAIQLDRTNNYQNAWNIISKLWRNNELCYSEKIGNEQDRKSFIEAVKLLHDFILRQQDETS